jgi:hypothetical protein
VLLLPTAHKIVLYGSLAYCTRTNQFRLWLRARTARRPLRARGDMQTECVSIEGAGVHCPGREEAEDHRRLRGRRGSSAVLRVQQETRSIHARTSYCTLRIRGATSQKNTHHFSILLLPHPRHRLPGTRRQPPRSPSRGQPGPHGPRRTRPPPYPRRRTSGRTHAWST